MKKIIILISILLGVSFVFSQTVYVNSSTGDDTNGDGSSSNPYKTFYKGYTQTSSGGTLNLSGTFTWTDAGETGDVTNTGFTINKNITIQGQDTETTIIQAATTENTADRRVFTVRDATIFINDLTIQYGQDNSTSGDVFAGGIAVGYGHGTSTKNTTLTIDNCIITRNNSNVASGGYYRGGGIGACSADLTVTNCQISHNSSSSNAYGSGGLYTVRHYGLNIQNTSITNNSGTDTDGVSTSYSTYSGGITEYSRMSGNTGQLTNVTIANNSSNSSGGGMILAPGSGQTTYLTNITCANNSSSGNDYAGLYIPSSRGTAEIKNCIFVNNSGTGTGYDINGSTTNNGYNVLENYSGFTTTTGDITDLSNLNLSASPELNSSLNPSLTLSIASNSSAKNSGSSVANGSVSIPTNDQRNYPRIDGTDIGAFEYVIISTPTTQATSVLFPGTAGDEAEVSWTNGDGQSRIVFAKQGTSGTTAPVDETTYTASATFGSGDQIGSTGWYCVYKGSSNSFTMLGLSTNTDYRLQVFEFNGSGGMEKYLTTTASGNPANVNSGALSSPTVQTNTIAAVPGQTTVSLEWSNGNGKKRAVFMKHSPCGEAYVTDLNTYTASTTFGNGTQLGTTGWYCVYNGTGYSVSITGLTSGEPYRVQSFEYNGAAGEELYLKTTASNNPTTFKTTSLILDDGFETGDFSANAWNYTSGNADFQVTDAEAYSGDYSAESGNIVDGQYSTLQITKTLSGTATVSFFKKVSSEASFDKLYFYIDDVEKDNWSGNVDWSYEEYSVTAGEHTFKWKYAKDGSVSSGSDAAWVDEVKITPGGGASNGNQHNFYVDAENGSDSDYGYYCSPLKTFHAAYENTGTGDTITIIGTVDWSSVDETGDAENTGYTLSKNIIIRGEEADQSKIQAYSSAPPNSQDRRVFTVSSGTTVTIEELTLRYGSFQYDQGYSGSCVSNEGTLYLNYCNVSYNSNYKSSAGGLYNASGATMEIYGCTIDHNMTYYFGGGIYNAGTLKVTNSTIFANNCPSSVDGRGGGIYHNNGTATITNTTISENYVAMNSSNYGGGIQAHADIYIKNCILANNYANTNTINSDYYASGYYDETYNSIIEQPQGYDNDMTNGTNGNLVGTGLALNISSSLAENNTSNGTFTLALSSGSVAINAGSETANNGVSIPSSDQRGFSRSGSTDIGAYEYDGSNPDMISWGGSTSNDWNTESNWSGGTEPTSSSIVTIPSGTTFSPVISSGDNAECSDLTVSNGATLCILSGGSLITSGSITNNGSIEVEQSISDGRWHLISSPVTSHTASIFTGDYLQYWSEDGQTWTDIEAASFSLIPVRGYALWGTAKGAYTFTGTPNSGEKNITLSYHNSGENAKGMNLVGNPYPSSIDWATLHGSYGAAYVWNATSSTYITNTDANIAPMQGFFIYTSNNESTFTLQNSNRSHGGSFLKEGLASKGLKLKAPYMEFADELILLFDESAEEGFNLFNDAWKLISGSQGVSQIWSYNSDGMLSIDKRPETSSIQLGFANNQSGAYSIQASEINGLDKVVLVDTKLDVLHDLSDGPYTFDWEAGEDEKRFKLSLNTTAVENLDIPEVQIYAQGDRIIIKTECSLDNNQITIYDLAGRKTASYEAQESVPAPKVSGIYLIQIQGAEQNITRKLIIK